MDISTDEKVSQVACRAMKHIRELANEARQTGIDTNEYHILSVMVKLLSPEYDIKRAH